jgi:hypothetical protein
MTTYKGTVTVEKAFHWFTAKHWFISVVGIFIAIVSSFVLLGELKLNDWNDTISINIPSSEIIKTLTTSLVTSVSTPATISMPH